jgi:hypothetical protein
MTEHGALWDQGSIFADDVEVVFNPRRWMGTLSYPGRREPVWDGVYILKMDDGTFAQIKIWKAGLSNIAGATRVTADFNPP